MIILIIKINKYAICRQNLNKPQQENITKNHKKKQKPLVNNIINVLTELRPNI